MSPETLLRCARKAKPHRLWKEIGKLGKNNPMRMVISEQTRTQKADVFDLENEGHQMALQKELEKDGWEFQYRSQTSKFRACKGNLYECEADNKPELLAACVESTQE